MRLTKQQTEAITQTVTRLAGIGTAIYLFGSRLNDQAKGGDIDLFIESDTQLSLILREDQWGQTRLKASIST